MSFSSAINAAVSGLTVSSLSLQAKASNIANANNPNYAARDVNVRTGALGGVEVASVTPRESGVLTAERRVSLAISGQIEKELEVIEALSRAFGDADGNAGVFDAVTRLESSLADLASTPESTAFQRSVLSDSQALVSALNQSSAAITDVRTAADQEIAALVGTVNTALTELEQLHRPLLGGPVDGLSERTERRAVLIDQVAEALDIVVANTDDGQIRIRTTQGVTLLGETARNISFSVGGIVSSEVRFEENELSGLSVDDIDITPGQGAQAIEAGKLIGLLRVRDEIAVEIGTRFDALAEDLVTRFSGTAVDPTLSGGEQGLFTNPNTGPGAAGRIAVNSNVDPDQGGELWRLRAGINATTPGPAANEGVTRRLLQALETPRAVSVATSGPGEFGFADAVAATSSVLGTDLVNARRAQDAASADLAFITAEERGALGVNTDAELQELVLIEQAYAANARVLQVIDDMLARLMEI